MSISNIGLTRRRSNGSLFLASLDPKIKERILNTKIEKHVLKKFEEEEKTEEVSYISDLRDLKTKSEREVYETLNRMFKNRQ